MTPEPKYLANLVIDATVACVSDSDPEEGGEADVLEDTVWDGLPILRPEGEAGSKRRGDEDDEDGGDAEIEEGILALGAAALDLFAHFQGWYGLCEGLGKSSAFWGVLRDARAVRTLAVPGHVMIH